MNWDLLKRFIALIFFREVFCKIHERNIWHCFWTIYRQLWGFPRQSGGSCRPLLCANALWENLYSVYFPSLFIKSFLTVNKPYFTIALCLQLTQQAKHTGYAWPVQLLAATAVFKWQSGCPTVFNIERLRLQGGGYMVKRQHLWQHSHWNS